MQALLIILRQGFSIYGQNVLMLRGVYMTVTLGTFLL